MKRLILFLAVAFAFCSPIEASIPISGTIQHPNGNKLNGKIRFTLSYSAARDTSNNSVTVASVVEFPVNNGSLPSTARIVPNDVLLPTNTWYTAEYFTSFGTRFASQIYYIAGTSFVLGQATPTPITTSNISFGSFTGLDEVSARVINNARMCDQFPGATGGAKIAACIANIPSGGGIADATGFPCGTQALGTTTITIPAKVYLYLSGCVTWTGNNATAMFQTSNSGSSFTANYGGGIIQQPGGVLQYTGAGAAILLSAGGESNFLNGFTVDVDTIDCNNGTGTYGGYGIKFGNAGWVQRTNVRFKHIWHCATAGIGFQLGRKNGNLIYGGDIDLSNAAYSAAMGTNGVIFEDSSAQAGYALYEANHLEIASIRNSTGAPLSVYSAALNNVFTTDLGNDFATVALFLDLKGAHNTVNLAGGNPWADFSATSTGAICAAGTCQQTFNASFYMNSQTFTASENTISVSPHYLNGMALKTPIVNTKGVPIQDHISAPVKDTLILNGSFENPAAANALGWTAVNAAGGTGAHTDAVADGSYSYAVVSTAGSQSYIYQSLPAIAQGKTVIACAWFRWNAGGSATAAPSIALHDNLGESYVTLPPAIANNGNAGVVVGDSNFYYLCTTRNLDAAASSMQIRLYADRAAGAQAATVFFDGAGVYMGNMPSLFSSKVSDALGLTAVKSITFANGANSNIDVGVNAGNIVSMDTIIEIVGPTGAYGLTGFTGGVKGQRLKLIGTTGQAFTLTNNATSTQKLLTLTGADVVLGAGVNAVGDLYCDGTFWWVLSARDVTGPR